MSEVERPQQNLGDVMDKLTILTRKLYFGLEDAVSEHRYLEKGLSAFGISGKLITNVIRLAQMNFEIWNLEHEIRNGGEDKFTLEEIGRRALKIRDLNKKRIEYKNKITELTGIDHKEVKINHHSA